MARLFASCLILTMLCGCAAATPTTASTPVNAPSATTSNTPSPLPTDTPTTTITPTETPAHAEIDPSQPPNLWPEEIRALFADVIKNPHTATPAERQAYDTYLTTQWKLILKDAGVANVDTLQGNSFLEAISSYDHDHSILEADLPMNLIQETILNADNLIPFGLKPGGDQHSKDDYYGVGEGAYPTQTLTDLLNQSTSIFDHVTIFGNLVDLKNIPSSLDELGVSGDVEALINIPGVDPEVAEAALVRMVGSDGKIGFAIPFFPYKNSQMYRTSPTDLCETIVGMRRSTPDCGVTLIPDAAYVFRADKPTIHIFLTRTFITVLLRNYPLLHINALVGGVGHKQVWIDGMATAGDVIVSSNIDLQAAQKSAAEIPTPTP